MFRANRSAVYKQTSLDLIPYLGKIVSQPPTDHAITSHNEWESSGFIYRMTEHLLKYDKVMYSAKKISGRQPATAIVKIIEEIRGIRKSGLEWGQSSPASIMRMSVEMSAP